MSWITKRILLNSYEDMDITLREVVKPFIDEVKDESEINGWYCSRKTEDDGSKPSIRIYLDVNPPIWNKLDVMLKEKQNTIGWTGEYNSPDPVAPNPNKSNLQETQHACEISLRLMEKYPNNNRHLNEDFILDLKNEVNKFVETMNDHINWEALHFIANNLGLRDELIFQLANK